MELYEERLKNFMLENSIEAEQLAFSKSCHSVQEAADAAGVSAKDFVKNICLIDNMDNLIVAIVKGEDRVSTSKVGKALQFDTTRTATESEIFDEASKNG